MIVNPDKFEVVEKNCWIKDSHRPNINNQTIKGTVLQIEKALINDLLRISNVSWKFHILDIYKFAIIYPRNLLFS